MLRGVKRSEKAARIQAILDRLYPELLVPLEHEDPYTLLVAVLLSAQCSDLRVNQITPLLFARARRPAQMAALDVAEIQRIIRPCGLAPAKARHIRELSRLLLERHAGRVPRSFEELEALPGVGHKTASVVIAQAFGRPAFPVDTHIHRLAARWGLSSGRNVATTERDLKRLWPESTWNRLHLQLIYFGRQHCPARAHDPQACPICCWAAVRARLQRETRARRPERPAPAQVPMRRKRKSGPSASRRARRSTTPSTTQS